MTRQETKAAVLAKLGLLHGNVDGYFAKYRVLAGQHLNCQKGCSACCQVQLSVFSCEAEKIQHWVETLSATQQAEIVELLNQPEDPIAANAAGQCQAACVFLKSGSCTIYPARPLICRTQGAILLLGKDFDVCPLNFTDPNSLLPAKEWLHLEKLNEVLSSLQGEFEGDGSKGTRVLLSDVRNRILKALNV
jgi:uncharacterized protein